MPKPLWAPWRLDYVSQAGELPGCPLCAEASGETGDSLVVHRGERAFALLNKYPYASGHLMIAPLAHAGGLEELDDATAVEIHRLSLAGMAALRATYRPDGFNLGWNLGRVAGAGIADHVHLHVVPRWAGDTSFLPVLDDVKVLPEHLRETLRKLRVAWPADDRGSSPGAPDR